VFFGRDVGPFLENEYLLTGLGKLSCDDCAAGTRTHDNHVYTHHQVALLQSAFNDRSSLKAREL